MAINIAYATRSALTIGSTEVSINSGTTTFSVDTTDGYFQLFVDLTNVAAGDTFEIAVTEAARASGTARRVVLYRAVGAQSEALWIGPALLLGNGWDYGVKKIAGTDRAVDATIRSVT